MTELMKVVTELIPNNKQNTLEQNLESRISTTIKSYRSIFFLPKISITTVTAIVTFLFLFPNQIKEHSTLSAFINPTNDLFIMAWITLLFCSILLWIIAFTSEEKSKRKLSLLKVDSFQNNIFDKFLDLESEKDNEFTKEGLTHFIYDKANGKKPNLSLNMRRLFTPTCEAITMEISQNVAEIIIVRAEKNKVVKKVTYSTLCDTYEIINYIRE